MSSRSIKQNDLIAFEFKQRTLDNGLRVIVQEDHTTPVVSVHVMYHVGSKHERPGRTGFAHLFEHLMFQGSEHVAEDAHFRYIQNAGGTLNGSTWFDRTNYFETLPVNELELGLWLESDRMGFFESAMTQKKLDNQRDVVKNERLQSYENRPYGLAIETILQMVYPEGHPYRHPTIGFMEDLDAASLSDVKEFFRTYYTPDNAVLVLVGAISADDGFAVAERYFGEIPNGPGTPQVTALEVAPAEEQRCEIYDNVQFPRVYLFHHTPALARPGFEDLEVLSYLMSEGKSSRLYHSLVYEKRIAQDLAFQLWPTEDCGLSFVVATARAGVSAAELEGALLESFDELLSGDLTDGEVQGAINRTLRDLVLRLNGVGRRSDAIATSATFLDQPEYVNEILRRVSAAEAESIVEVAKHWLVPDRRATLFVLPKNSGEDGRG